MARVGGIGEILAAERRRWVLWLPVCLGAGIVIYFMLPVEPPRWSGIAIGVAACVLLAITRVWSYRLFLPAIAVLAIATGFAAAQLRAVSVAAPVLEKRLGPVSVEGRVVSVRRVADGGRRLVLERPVIGRLAPDRTPERVRVKLRAAPTELRPGNMVSVRAILMPPPSPASPGAFDFARLAYFQRLGAVGFAVSRVRIVDPAGGGSSWSLALARLRHSILARLRHSITARIISSLDAPTGAVAAALMTGERGAIPDEVLGAMRDAGLAHLLAISGLHVGLVAGILFFALRLVFSAIEPLVLRRPVKIWAAMGALMGAFCYLLISGATVPTQRAFIMLAVVLLAVTLDRTALSMRLVALAAALVLLIAPESLLSASFQLSFAAVVALIAVYESMGARFAKWHGDGGLARRFLIYGLGVVLTTLVAGIATGPFAVYHFNRLALYGLAANLIAVPLAGFWIMPWAIVAFLLMPFGLEALALAPMGWGIDAVIETARTVASWPGAVKQIPAMPPAAIGLVTIGGLWLCLWRTRWRAFGLVAVVAGLSLLPGVRPPDVLIDGSGRLMAVKADDGALALSSRRVARFEGEIWLRRAGETAALSWPREGYGAGGRLACDALGCIYRAHGRTVALVRRADALAEDCGIATAVVSSVPVKPWRCRQPRTVIDRFDLWRHGAHALWLDGDAIRVLSVADVRGRRLWSPGRR